MCKYISELLGASEPFFTYHIRELERGSGNNSIDVGLTGEIIAKSSAAIRALGLDESDSTAEEVYQGLQQMTKIHDMFLAKLLNISAETSNLEATRSIVSVLESAGTPTKIFRVKPSSYKQLLKKANPLKTAKLMGYRTVASLIKREPLESIHLAVMQLESKSWQTAFLRKYKDFTATDFEEAPIHIEHISSKKYGKLMKVIGKNRNNSVLSSYETGSVLVDIGSGFFDNPGAVLTIILVVVHKLEEFRAVSSYLKLRQFDRSFGSLFKNSLLNGFSDNFVIAGQPLVWRAVGKNIGSPQFENFANELSPHMNKSDFSWVLAEEILYQLEPALHFWHGLEFVGRPVEDERPVSFSLIDNAINLFRDLDFENRHISYFRERLNEELHSRYIRSENFVWHMKHQLVQHGHGSMIGLAYNE